MTTTCPNCAHSFNTIKAIRKPRTRVRLTELTATDRLMMSDSEIHAHYRATSHVEDVRFVIKHGIIRDMPTELRIEWESLLEEAESGSVPRRDVQRKLRSLQARWNTFKNDRDRLNGGWQHSIAA